MTVQKPTKEAKGAESRRATRSFWLFGNRLTVLADHTDTGGYYNLTGGRQPAGDQTPHVHTRYGERLYVVDGELTIWADGLETVLHTGDTFTVPAGTAHAVPAMGEGVTHADPGRFLEAAARLGDEQLGPLGTLPEV